MDLNIALEILKITILGMQVYVMKLKYLVIHNNNTLSYIIPLQCLSITCEINYCG